MTIFGLHTNTHSPQLAICKEFNWPDHSGQSEIKREENQEISVEGGTVQPF